MERRVLWCALSLGIALAAGTARAQSPNDHDHVGQNWFVPGAGLHVISNTDIALRGSTSSPWYYGIFGMASSTTGNASGVHGLSQAPQGAGVYGVGYSSTNSTMGVYGETIAPYGTGVLGRSWYATGTAVSGINHSPDGIGVYGYAPFPGRAGFFQGNTVVGAPGSLSFESTTRQMLNLWGPAKYGIGVQPSVMYFRADGASRRNGFAWFKGGSHVDAAYDAGGGQVLMKLDETGLTVNGTFVSSSDAAAKQDVTAADVHEVLERVGRLPIQQWSYRNDPDVRHLGPMAQDFRSAFGLGQDERHIAMVDADGVALAAIQALRELVSAQRSELVELRALIADQASRIQALTPARTAP
jgi:hypothetical protein